MMVQLTYNQNSECYHFSTGKRGCE